MNTELLKKLANENSSISETLRLLKKCERLLSLMEKNDHYAFNRKYAHQLLWLENIGMIKKEKVFEDESCKVLVWGRFNTKDQKEIDEKGLEVIHSPAKSYYNLTTLECEQIKQTLIKNPKAVILTENSCIFKVKEKRLCHYEYSLVK